MRGRIVDALRSGPVSVDTLTEFARPGDTPDDLDRIVQGLIRDGLAEQHDRELRLPNVKP